VRLFHFWKRVSAGRALWLRNNGSTLVSQLVDTSAVVLISHYGAHVLPLRPELPVLPQLGSYIASGYLFKALAALADTLPFYLLTALAAPLAGGARCWYRAGRGLSRDRADTFYGEDP